MLPRPRIKIITRIGTPNSPAIWYQYLDDAERVKVDMEKNPKAWSWSTLMGYKDGSIKFEWTEADPFDDDPPENNPNATWYGVALDLEPEVNDFGPIIP